SSLSLLAMTEEKERPEGPSPSSRGRASGRGDLGTTTCRSMTVPPSRDCVVATLLAMPGLDARPPDRHCGRSEATSGRQRANRLCHCPSRLRRRLTPPRNDTGDGDAVTAPACNPHRRWSGSDPAPGGPVPVCGAG